MRNLISITAVSLIVAVGASAGLLASAVGLSLLTAAPAVAQDVRSPSGLPVPRFETIDSVTVRMRQGPSTSHRILWEFRDQEGLPVEIVAETEQWRQIRDPDGDLGWVHRSLLSGDRGAVVTGGMRALRMEPADEAPTIAYMEPRVVVDLGDCTSDWCQVTVASHTGWVHHDEIWGVYPAEVVQ